MAKILVVEDDETMASMVIDFLESERFLVDHVPDGSEGSSLLKVNQYDAIILDWDLPGMKGIEILKEFRGRGGQTPIIMLTGKGKIDEKEEGLNSGADDYLTKPFNIKELGARLRAILRRPPVVVSTSFTVGNISLDPQKHRVTKDGASIHLLPRDFAILELFMRYPDEVFSAEALLSRAWHSDADATIDGLRTAIKRIRQKIDDAGDESKSLIETIPRIGYRLRSE